MMKKNKGVFLFGFGAPSSIDDEGMACFLESVTGRKADEIAVASLKKRYEAIGGKSPMVDMSRKQKRALRRVLDFRNMEIEVYFGMRCGAPSIQDAVKQAVGDGVEIAAAITHAPQHVPMIADAYADAARRAVENSGGSIDIRFATSYGTRPGFIDAVCEKLIEIFRYARGIEPCDIPIVFTAHSLPGDEAVLKDYTAQLREAAISIVRKIRGDVFEVAFQSKGRGPNKWLGPSIEDVIDELARKKHGAVALCPIGFVTENLETLYDLDIEASGRAEAAGMTLYRAAALDDSRTLMETWADIVSEIFEESA